MKGHNKKGTILEALPSVKIQNFYKSALAMNGGI